LQAARSRTNSHFGFDRWYDQKNQCETVTELQYIESRRQGESIGEKRTNKCLVVSWYDSTVDRKSAGKEKLIDKNDEKALSLFTLTS
jgi:hypothetical protein